MVEDVRTAIPGTVKILNSRRVGGGGRDTLRYWFNRETEFRSTPFPPGHNYDTHTHLTELTAPLLPFRTPTVHRPLFPGGKRIPHCQCMMTLLMTCLPSWWPWKLVTEGGRDWQLTNQAAFLCLIDFMQVSVLQRPGARSLPFTGGQVNTVVRNSRQPDKKQLTALISLCWTYGYVPKRTLQFGCLMFTAQSAGKVVVVDRFYIALVSALEQTHCARIWFYTAFYSAFLNFRRSLRDQEEGGELDSHEEVRLSFAGPSFTICLLLGDLVLPFCCFFGT